VILAQVCGDPDGAADLLAMISQRGSAQAGSASIRAAAGNRSDQGAGADQRAADDGAIHRDRNPADGRVLQEPDVILLVTLQTLSTIRPELSVGELPRLAARVHASAGAQTPIIRIAIANTVRQLAERIGQTDVLASAEALASQLIEEQVHRMAPAESQPLDLAEEIRRKLLGAAN
jgi:hypothetical protein